MHNTNTNNRPCGWRTSDGYEYAKHYELLLTNSMKLLISTLPVGTDMRILPSAALPRTAVTLQLSCCSTSAIRRDAFRSSNLRQSSSLEQERPISLDTASSQSPSYAPPKGANKSTY